MTLFEFTQKAIFVLISLIIIIGSLIVLMTIESIVGFIINRIKRKKAFDLAQPVGTIFPTKVKQKFPYGKWLLVGKDQHDFYIYERIK